MKFALAFLLCFVAVTYATSSTRDNLVGLLRAELDTMNSAQKQETVVTVLLSLVPQIIDVMFNAAKVGIQSVIVDTTQMAFVQTILDQANSALKNVTSEALAPIIEAQTASRY